MGDTKDNKKESTTQVPEVKSVVQQQAPVIQTSTATVKKTQTIESKPNQSQKQTISLTDQKSKNLSGKKLQLVLYQVAKQGKSVFTQEQKFPIMASFGGVFLTLCTATMINVGQFIIKPEQKKKKLFILFGVGNLLAATFLIGYSIFKISDMYMKVPELEWARIQQQKQQYEKLPFADKKAFLMKQIQEDEQKLKEKMIQIERKRRQEMIELTK